MKPLPMVLASLLILTALSPALAQPYLGQGELVGEVTPTSAIVRTRLTQSDKPTPGLATTRRSTTLPAEDEPLPEDWPGASGVVQVVYGLKPDLSDAKPVSAPKAVDQTSDFSAQFPIKDLTPATTYYYRAELVEFWVGKRIESIPGRIGQFKTAPAPDQSSGVKFVVVTGQAMRSRDLTRPDGSKDFASYASMAALKPDFFVHTGDNVYYDNDGVLAANERLMRYHWNRLYGLPNVRSLFAIAPAYFEKDDHDYRWNDCSPQDPTPNRLGQMITDELGRKVFLQEVPMGDTTYRSYIWGKGLQVWFTEGRDFRTANQVPDSPEKSMWGAKQKQWLKETLAASTARYKILISPTPIIGPDRAAKGDNHSTTRPTGFHTEGQEFLKFIADQKLDGFYIICGDRHWQYHSVDPVTKVQEFSCGPISDLHAQGGPGYIAQYHKYYLQKGGFLSVQVQPKDATWQITFTHHRPDGTASYTVVNP